MTRMARIVAEGLPHHVILRGNNRRRLFSYPGDYLFLLGIMYVAAIRHRCRVSAWCLMTNHVHLIVTPTTSEGLAAFVKHVAQCFAQRRNAARGGSGKLFEERYKSKPITTEVQLAASTAYIDLNPVRAGMVDDPRDYRWSSCAMHVGGKASRVTTRLWDPSSWYLGLGSAPERRARAYADFLASYVGRTDPDAEPALRDPPAPRGSNRTLRPDGSSAR